MAYLNYEGDLGEYPLLSMFSIPANALFTTNAVSVLGNKGAFYLTHNSLGFVSKSIFGMREFQKVWLSHIKSIKIVDLALNGYCLQILSKELIHQGVGGKSVLDFVSERKKFFPEKWGNSYTYFSEETRITDPYYKDYMFHNQEVNIILSSAEKANYLDVRINFQIGANSSAEEFRNRRPIDFS